MYSISELEEKVPAITRTLEEGPELGASKFYKFMTTFEIIESLALFGWKLYDGCTQKTKKNPLTAKHMLRFRHNDFGDVGINGSIPEILLVNSHNRTASLNFHVGVFKIICSNGLIVASETFAHRRIRHMGVSFDDVKEIIVGLTAKLPLVFGMIESFQDKILTDNEKLDFAYQSLAVRYPEFVDEKTNKIDKIKINKVIDIDEVLLPLREEDSGNSLWSVFNLLQEKMIKGGFNRQGLGKAPRLTRPISNIRTNVTINKELWELCESYSNN